MTKASKLKKYLITHWEIWDMKSHYQPPQVDLSELNMFSYYLQILANRSERGIYSINLYNSLEEIEEDIYGVCVFKHQQWRSKDFKEIYNSLNKQEFLRKINALIEEYGNAVITDDVSLCIKTDESIRLKDWYDKMNYGNK